MKNALNASLVLGLTGLLCLSSAAPTAVAKELDTPVVSQDQEDLAARVLALETEVKDLKLANKEQEALLTQAIKYMEGQAASGAKLAKSVDQSVSMGFTKGINFQSREVLVAAFKAHCAALQKDVPRLPKAAPAPVTRRR